MTLDVTTVHEDATTITLGWTPPAGQEGYVATLDGSEVLIDGKRHGSLSKTNGSIRIGKPQDGKPHSYGVEILGVTASGAVTSPTPTPPPAAGKTGCAGYAAGDYTKRASIAGLDAMMVDLNGVAVVTDFPKVFPFGYRSTISCNRTYNNGIPHDVAAAGANGKSWLLPGIVNKDYPSNDILDISNPDCSRALARYCIQWAQQNGFKGLWLDDLVRHGESLCNALPSGWTEDTWHQYVVQHATILGDAIKAAGLLPVPNCNGRIPGDSNSDDGTLDLQFWGELAAHFSGFTHEYWQQRPTDLVPFDSSDSTWYSHWNAWRRLHTFCNQAGVAFMPLSYADTGSAVAFYYRVSFLLDWDPARGSALISGTPANQGEPGGAWSADIGLPSGPAQSLGNGVYSRPFKGSGGGPVTAKIDTVNLVASISVGGREHLFEVKPDEISTDHVRLLRTPSELLLPLAA